MDPWFVPDPGGNRQGSHRKTEWVLGISSRKTLTQRIPNWHLMLLSRLHSRWPHWQHTLKVGSYPIPGRTVLISLILSLLLGFTANQEQSIPRRKLSLLLRHSFKRLSSWLCISLPPFLSPVVNSGQNDTYFEGGTKTESQQKYEHCSFPPKFCLLNVSLESGKENKTKGKMRHTKCSNTSLFSSHRLKKTTLSDKRDSCRLERIHWIRFPLMTAS